VIAATRGIMLCRPLRRGIFADTSRVLHLMHKIRCFGCCRIRRSRFGRCRGGPFLETLNSFNPSFTGITAPDRFDRVCPPVGPVADTAGERCDGSSPDAGFTPHPDALEFAELVESVDADDCSDCKAGDRDTAKTVVGLFDKVLQVHSVETGVEGSGGQTEGTNAELEIEKHEGVAVCVENRFDTVIRLDSICA